MNFQLQLTKRQDVIPLTRKYIDQRELLLRNLEAEDVSLGASRPALIGQRSPGYCALPQTSPAPRRDRQHAVTKGIVGST
jgi:hypothetical protein